ncbi:hypothetical protein ACOZE3_23455 [Streptomyces cinereoruber]|uniref:hypothetical protein n=1 Tax=Streptomyces cinereoruber TaxID=67260 RepID=UPI003BF4A3DF
MPLICLVRHGQASSGRRTTTSCPAPAATVGRDLARRGLRDPHLVAGALNRQRDTAGPLAAGCGALLSLPDEGVVALNRVVVNASVTTLVVGGSGTTLLTFNGHAHFVGDRRRMVTYR